jgi:hypothetical protein
MKTILFSYKAFLICSLIFISLSFSVFNQLFGQNKDTSIIIIEDVDTNIKLEEKPTVTLIIITAMSDRNEDFEDVQYSSIEMSEIIDFDKLLRVYINSNSIILLDMEPSSIDKVRGLIYEKLKANVENKIGEPTVSSIANYRNDLKILVRKSIYTNKDDYGTMLDMINNAIWDLHNYYANKTYSTDYKQLNNEQKINIKKLLPLKNFLANDKEL